MTFKEFYDETKRTLPALHSQYGLALETSKLVPNILDTVHMRLGIVSEIEELMVAIHKGDKVGIGEELTDILWYVSNDIRINFKRGLINTEQVAVLLNYNFTKGLQATDGGFMSISEGVNYFTWAIVYNASKLSDFVKKDIAYGKTEIGDNWFKATGYLLGAVNNVAYTLGVNLEEYMQKVIDKLRRRYPEKFNSDNAINRDTNAERVILEGGTSQQDQQPQDQ